MKKVMITKKVKKVAMKELVTSFMVFNLSRMERGTDPENTQEGRLECNFKYIHQNCFSYFSANRSLLTIVAWNDCHEAIIVSKPLLVKCVP